MIISKFYRICFFLSNCCYYYWSTPKTKKWNSFVVWWLISMKNVKCTYCQNNIYFYYRNCTKKEFYRNAVSWWRCAKYVIALTSKLIPWIFFLLMLYFLSICVVVTVEKPVALSYIENMRLFNAVKNFHFHYNCIMSTVW